MSNNDPSTKGYPNDVPPQVFEWIRHVFRECNRRVTLKISNNPNIQEPSLDMSWIDEISQFSTAVKVGDGWIVDIKIHYLGGMRHFHNWEIADIGFLLFVRRGNAMQRSKVALLQSKRLYPTNNRVREDGRLDFETGFARLADPEDLGRSLDLQSEFEFTDKCEYGALISGSNQVRAIKRYELERNIAVHYQFYNPWSVPFKQKIPLEWYGRPSGEMSFGTRIIAASTVHEFLDTQVDGYRLSLEDLRSFAPHKDRMGWPIEDFVADLFIPCKEGTQFGRQDTDPIRSLFYRRSGPISAAIAITIEGPSLE
ncbi:MAG: hypothetical protein NXI14_10590 [bacterium]|nr:hypothetical protein [bacterium]